MSTSRLARYFHRLFRQTRPIRRPLWLEPLENRETPAAIVSAVFNAGVLTLIGLDSAIAADTTHNLTVTGENDGAVDVSVAGNTQFRANAADTVLSFIGVNSIAIDLRGGDDVLMLNDLDLTGGVIVSLGEGADQVTIDGTTRLGGALMIDAGAGAASVTVGSAGRTTRVGGMTLRSGDGDTMTTFAGATNVAGDFTAVRGSGTDTFLAAGDLRTTGSVAFDNGVGTSDATFAGNTNVAGNFSIQSFSGQDRLTITGPSFNVGGMFNQNVNISGSNITVSARADVALEISLLLRATAGEDVIWFAGELPSRGRELALANGDAIVNFEGDTGSSMLAIVTAAGNETFRWAADAASSDDDTTPDVE